MLHAENTGRRASFALQKTEEKGVVWTASMSVEANLSRLNEPHIGQLLL